jgi:hypothetical protein
MHSKYVWFLAGLMICGAATAQQERGPRMQPGTLNDQSPWEHMGDDATNLRAVGGTVSFDVNEIENSGRFHAELDRPEGHYVIDLIARSSITSLRWK